MADVAYIGGGASNGSGTAPATTRVVTASGNTLVAILAHASGTESISDTAGNTWALQVTQTSTGRCVIWTATANASGSTTINCVKGTSGAWSLCVAEFSGVDSSSPVTSSGGANNSTSNTSKVETSPALSVLAGGAFVGGCYASATFSSVVYSTATTIATSGRGTFAYRLNASSFSEDGAFTHGTAATGAGAGVALQKTVVASGGNNQTLLLMGV